MESASTSLSLDHLMEAVAYLAKRKHIFPSDGALDWYIRKNRQQLIEGGALKLIRGRWMIDAPAFDRQVIEAGSAAAARKVEVSA